MGRRGLQISVLVLMALCYCAAYPITSDYESAYSYGVVGSPTTVPWDFGGLTFKAGDPNTILLIGHDDTWVTAIYSVGVTRDASGHINGLSGSEAFYADAPFADGGLGYGPGNTLFYTGYPRNLIGEILPGSTSPDKQVNLNWGSYYPSVGALQFIPNTDQLAITSYSSSDWFRATLSPDGNGTYDVSEPLSTVQLQYKPEGIYFVPQGSPLFPNPTVLIMEYQGASIVAYDLDANNDPIASTRRVVADTLGGVIGAATDPLTDDLLFVQFGGGSRISIISGFAQPGSGLDSVTTTPEPATVALVGASLLLGMLKLGLRTAADRRKKKASTYSIIMGTRPALKAS